MKDREDKLDTLRVTLEHANDADTCESLLSNEETIQ